MNITDIRIRKPDSFIKNPNVRAIISATVDSALVIHDMRVAQREDKTYLYMPSRNGTNGKRYNYFHPINNSVRGEMEEQILNAFFEWDEKNNTSEPIELDDFVTELAEEPVTNGKI